MYINLNATDPAAPSGAQNVHFRADTNHLGTAADPEPVSAYVMPMTGDSGSGGASGLVPAPAAGDAAAGKLLKADGTWFVPPVPTGAANEVLATPSGAAGAAALRPLVAADLPVATISSYGAVQPDGTTITINSVGRIVAPPPLVIGFVMLSGAVGTNAGPMLVAPRAGSITQCVLIVKASDSSLPLTFRINQNGTDIFSSDPTIPAGAASGSVLNFNDFTSTPLAIAAGGVLTIDISSGSGAWSFTAQLE